MKIINREILFRGKHIHTIPGNEHLNGTWVHGYLSDKNHIYDKNLEGEFLVDENTICQYTGEKDKNGQKIYEGDILEAHLDDSFPENVTRVRVTWENMKWCLVQKGMIPDPFEAGEGKDWEVIGNIFDNPELIGDTKDGESR